jgi:malonate decarboxylase delta subunit
MPPAPASRRVLVGVVGSGDLEVMIEPGEAGKTSIDVTTSVNGYGASGMRN